MKQLIRNDDEERFSHSSDVTRLVNVAQRAGYIVSRSDAKWAWEEFSDTMAAGWLSMDLETDESILAVLKYRLREIDT